VMWTVLARHSTPHSYTHTRHLVCTGKENVSFLSVVHEYTSGTGFGRGQNCLADHKPSARKARTGTSNLAAEFLHLHYSTVNFRLLVREEAEMHRSLIRVSNGLVW
jgi:hypothetical protein